MGEEWAKAPVKLLLQYIVTGISGSGKTTAARNVIKGGSLSTPMNRWKV
ncbi:MAG: hypothetical protein ACQR33_04860 [Candidatus Saccharibacteria bacterium]